MATAKYKFVGVPKTFTSQAAALRFLLNSPGYVERRSTYLHTYWPGLMQELEKKKQSKAVSNKPTRTNRQAGASIGAGASGGHGLGSLIGHVAGSVADSVGDWAGDQATQTVGALMGGSAPTNRLSSVPAPVQRASKVAETVVPSPHTVETTGDWTVGKGLTNLAQGQGPKNWQDVAGLGVGVAGILPIGRGVKGAAALRQAFRGEKAAKAVVEGERAAAALTPAAKAAATRAARADRAARAARAVPEADWAALGATKAKQNLGTPVSPRTLNETVQDALKGAPEAIAAQNAAYSQERAIRASSAYKAYLDAGGGTNGLGAALGELKGALPKVLYKNEIQELTPETLDGMVRDIFDHPDLRLYEMISASKGLQRIVEGQSPQASQLALILRVFGKETADSLTSPEAKGLFGDLYQKGLKLWNVPRTVMASFDISAPFRQGLVAGARHPVIFAKNFKPMLKAWKSEDAFQGWLQALPERPNFQRYGKAKLNIQDVKGEYIAREEVFPGSYADPIPGIKHSARAYTAFLDKMRVDMFDYMIDVAAQRGKNVDDEGFLKALGEYINTATGRGKIPTQHGENAAQFLNTFLFSPRLLASRFQILNPNYYYRLAKQDKWVAAQALRATGQTIASISAMVYLASMFPGAKVGLNPRSSDFGKVRIGNTRLDFAGGFGPLVVLYSRLGLQETMSSTTGKVRKIDSGKFGDPTTWDTLWRFAQTKLAPSTALLVNVKSGHDLIGNPVTPQSVAAGMIPLNFQGAWEAYKQNEGNIPAGVAAGALGSIGFGVNTYPDKKTPVKYGRRSTRSNPFEADSGSNPFESNSSTYNPFEP